MPEKTAAQKRAQKNYMDKFAIARVRMEKSRYEDIQVAAAAVGESVNAYINTAITLRMGQDDGGTSPTRPQKAAGGPSGAGAISLPSDTLEAAQEAAGAAGEALPEFITRAVSETADRDKMTRKED